MPDIRDSAAFEKLTSGDPESFTAQFFRLLDEAFRQNGNTHGDQLPVVQGVDHLVHFNEMAEAFGRLTALVQAQQAALVKLSQDQDRTYRKVCLHVEGQAQYQLARWFWWAAGLGALFSLGGMFIAGALYNSGQADARIDRIIRSQPAASQASAFLASHGGSISLGPIALADGRQGRGVIIVRGALQETEATDGALLLTP
jgi:hypothetical protein